MTAAWMVRQGEGGSNAQELVEAGYMGVDFIGDRDLTPHLGGGLDQFSITVSSPVGTNTITGLRCRTGAAWSGPGRSAGRA